MRKLFFCFLPIIFGLLSYSAHASHIVGGVLNYKNIGNDTYEIRLTIFRDCFGNPGATFDNPAHIGIFDSNNNFVDSLQLALPGFDTLASSINSPCFTPPVGICYQRAVYVGNKVLPPIPGGYQLAYQRCCRNNTIQNIVTPGQVGATYYASIPDSNLANINSNPVFKNLPPLFLCINYPYTFDHSATDIDGDSLVYSLYTPLEGASQAVPIPIPTNPPPYFPLSFSPPYNLTNVMGGVPLSINPQTGSLTVSPNTQGQFVVGVQVAEYRNGLFLGATKRDVQFNVVPCPNLIVSEIVIPNPALQAIVKCGSNTVQFNNNSFGGVTYSWNFGDPNTLADTSHLFQPSYTYPGPGTYPSYLVAYGNNPNCNDTSFATIQIYPPFTSDISYQLNPCNKTVSFTDASTFPGFPITSRVWNFGDGSSSTQANPVHTYSNPGNYTVSIASSSNLGCSGNKSIVINIPSIPALNTSANNTICNGDSIQLSATGGINYVWTPSVSLINANTANPIAFPNNSTNYNLSAQVLTSSGDTCSANTSLTINVNQLPTPSIQINPIVCGNKTIQINNGSSNALSYQWNFGDIASGSNSSFNANPLHTFSDTGVFQISLIAFTQAAQTGCRDSIKKTIHIYPPVICGFSYDVESCSNTVSFFDSTADAFSSPSSWLWNFGDGQSSVLQNPIHQYASYGNFIANLIASTSVGCSDSVSLPINLSALAAAVGPNDTALCDGTPVRISASGGIAYLWTPSLGLSSDTVPDPIVNINTTTTYTVNITAVAADGDTCVITKNVTVFVPPASLPQVIATADQDTLYAGQSTLLHAIPDQANLFYSWSPANYLNSSSIANPLTTPPQSTNYLLTVSDSFQCNRNAEIKIVVIPLSCAENEVFVPSAFSPNNDGDNDVLYVRGLQIKELYFIVYNRWGEKVFESNDPKNGWNGFYKGQICEPAVYAFYARILCLNNNEIIKQGNITLLR